MTQRAAAFVIGSPVPGYIRPVTASSVLGSFKVTSTFAAHVASGRGPGVDIGNGRCGDTLIAEHAGTVTLAGYLGSAKVVRIKHPNGKDVSGYAHLATISVKVGQAVNRGQKIGTHGMTGATKCHLHGGYKRNGVEIDWWPLLEQNHSIQANAGATPNLRSTPAGAVVASVRLNGIYNLAGQKIAEHDALMTPRPVAAVKAPLGGVIYEWLPRQVGGLAIWVARNFVHFV